MTLEDVPARSAVEPVTSPAVRFVGVDGLRALAALSVLAYHCWRYSSPTGDPVSFGAVDRVLRELPVGVTLFFTLSGFLLYRPFAAATLRASRFPDVGSYLRNRALRIVPAYWVILLVVSLVMQVAIVRTSAFTIESGSLEGEPGTLAADALFVQSAHPSTLLTGIGPAWTLSVEVCFYLALPLLGLLAWRLGRRARTRAGRRLAACTPPLVLLALGVAGKLVAALPVPGLGAGQGWVGDWHSVLERSFFANADLFTFGMLVAVLHVERADGAKPIGSRRALLVAAAALAAASFLLFDRGVLSRYPFDTLLATACALLLAGVVLPAVGEGARVVRSLQARPIVWVGVVSYSVYLWHEPLVRWLQEHDLTAGGAAGLAVNLVVLTLVTCALSAVTYRWVERPALARRARGWHEQAAP